MCNFCIYNSIIKWVCLPATETQLLPAPMLLHDILIVRYIYRYCTDWMWFYKNKQLQTYIYPALQYSANAWQGSWHIHYGFQHCWFNTVNTAAFQMVKLYSRNTVIHLNWSLSSVTSLVLPTVRRNRSKQNLVYKVNKYASQTINIIQ